MNKKRTKEEIDQEIEKYRVESRTMMEVVKAKLDSPYIDDDMKMEIMELFLRVYKDETYKYKKYQQWWKDLRRLAEDEQR